MPLHTHTGIHTQQYYSGEIIEASDSLSALSKSESDSVRPAQAKTLPNRLLVRCHQQPRTVKCDSMCTWVYSSNYGFECICVHETCNVLKQHENTARLAEDRPVIISVLQLEKCETSQTLHLIFINAVQLHMHHSPILAFSLRPFPPDTRENGIPISCNRCPISVFSPPIVSQ